MISEADKGTFSLLTDDYARDKKTVFHKGVPLKEYDLASFSVLKGGYAKDGRRIYYEGKILTGADPVSFTLVDNEADRDAADKKQSYYAGQRVKLESE
ncbi:MAG TPA: DKNYY domain-containing protein [Fibrella sp.]